MIEYVGSVMQGKGVTGHGGNAKSKLSTVVTPHRRRWTRKQLCSQGRPPQQGKTGNSGSPTDELAASVSAVEVVGENVGVPGCTQVHPSASTHQIHCNDELYPSHPTIRTLCV